eukprot:2310398-Pyramimonas_sp.AAC.1
MAPTGILVKTQKSSVPITIGTIRTPSCKCLLGTKVSHMLGKRWFRAYSRMGMRMETQQTGIDIFSACGRLQISRTS